MRRRLHRCPALPRRHRATLRWVLDTTTTPRLPPALPGPVRRFDAAPDAWPQPPRYRLNNQSTAIDHPRERGSMRSMWPTS